MGKTYKFNGEEKMENKHYAKTRSAIAQFDKEWLSESTSVSPNKQLNQIKRKLIKEDEDGNNVTVRIPDAWIKEARLRNMSISDLKKMIMEYLADTTGGWNDNDFFDFLGVNNYPADEEELYVDGNGDEY